MSDVDRELVEELIEEIEDMRSWAAGCKSKYGEEAHDARQLDKEELAAELEGRRSSYYSVERVIVDKLLPVAERIEAENAGEAGHE